jgi:hypothetical protein
MSSPMNRCGVAAMVAVTIVGFIAGCATMNVNSYVGRGVDLRQYRTYNWAPPDTWSTGDPRLDNNRFFDERVRGQVEKELARRGFEKTADPQPDMLIHYHASVSQQIDIRELDSSKSYCADHDCQPFIYDKGTLFVDLVEPHTDKIIWRGWAEGSIDGVIDNQTWMESRIDEAVTKILARLPRHLPT